MPVGAAAGLLGNLRRDPVLGILGDMFGLSRPRRGLSDVDPSVPGFLSDHSLLGLQVHNPFVAPARVPNMAGGFTRVTPGERRAIQEATIGALTTPRKDQSRVAAGHLAPGEHLADVMPGIRGPLRMAAPPSPMPALSYPGPQFPNIARKAPQITSPSYVFDVPARSFRDPPSPAAPFGFADAGRIDPPYSPMLQTGRPFPRSFNPSPLRGESLPSDLDPRGRVRGQAAEAPQQPSALERGIDSAADAWRMAQDYFSRRRTDAMRNARRAYDSRGGDFGRPAIPRKATAPLPLLPAPEVQTEVVPGGGWPQPRLLRRGYSNPWTHRNPSLIPLPSGEREARRRSRGAG